MTFHNLVLVAHYQGAKATTVKTKPSGIHLKDRQLVYWNIKEAVLNTTEPHRVISRFVGTADSCPEPGHIEARWELNGSKDLPLSSGISLSRLESAKPKEESDDPFADESIASPTTTSPQGTWTEIETSKKIVSGKYEAK